MRTLILIVLAAGSALAGESEVEKLRRDLDEALRRLEQIEKSQPPAHHHHEGEEHRDGELWSGDLGGGLRAQLLELSLDLLMVGTWSTARTDEIGRLNAHHHDPHVRGFTLQNAELSAQGAVDPHFTAEIHTTWVVDSEGESEFELEEAFFTTTGLPGGLEVRGGHMNLAFGRFNTGHAHTWRFVNAPVVATRFLGEDGLRSQGARLAWRAPLPFFFEPLFGIYNANSGHGTWSFISDRGEEGPLPATPIAREVRSWRDLLYLGRIETGADFKEIATARFGLSCAHGPNGTGTRADTTLFGADALFRWTPHENAHGWPFVEFQAEFLVRRYERAAADDGGGTEYRHEWFQDWGAYAQVVVGFAERWTAGLRVDRAVGEFRNEDPGHNARWRFSPALSWHMTHFSRIRLQYDLDHASHLPNDRMEHQFSLQVEVQLGRHGAHRH